MSTRANIIIKDKEDQLIYYRHSDGYPSVTLPTLKKFMGWVKAKKIRDNVIQSAGWLVLIGAKEYEREYAGAGKWTVKPTITEPLKDADDVQGWQAGSYEPTTEIHADIEWLYTLDLVKLTITVQEVQGKGKYITVETVKDFTAKPE